MFYIICQFLLLILTGGSSIYAMTVDVDVSSPESFAYDFYFGDW